MMSSKSTNEIRQQKKTNRVNYVLFFSFFFKFNRQIYRNLINKLEFEGQKFLSKSYELKRRKLEKCNLQKWTPFSSASNSFLNMSKFFKFTPLWYRQNHQMKSAFQKNHPNRVNYVFFPRYFLIPTEKTNWNLKNMAELAKLFLV